MRTGLIVIAILLVAAGLGHFNCLEPLDQKLLDAQFGVLRAHALRPAKTEVVIVGIDDDTTRSLREPVTLWHPHLGKFLEATARSGAAAVGIDLVLPDRSYDGIIPGYDRKLLTGILVARRAAPVVLALTIDPAGQTRPIYPALVSAGGPDTSGYALFPVDPDGVVRRFDERIGVDGSAVPTFAGQLVRRLGRTAGHGLIDFTVGEEFTYIPLHTVLAWHDTGDAGKLERALKGKVVLLGSVLKYEDRLAAPVNLAAWDPYAINVPGVVLHAQALRNLLGDGLITPVPNWAVLVLCLLMVTLWFIAGNAWLGASAALAGSMTVVGVSTWGLTRGWYLPPAAILTTLTLAVAARVLFEATLKLRERRKLRRAFTGYVSPAVMNEILAGQLNPGLGGINKFVCVMFSDIRGYTTRSERTRPEVVIAFLNRYFEQVVNVIHARGGTVVSFMGDGIMAVFSAPKPLASPCAEAFAAAREMLQYVKEFNASAQATGEAPIEIGIGLHCGEAVVGHVGASSRHDYTAIGDVPNVASRLEGVTKDVGYALVASADVISALADKTGFDYLGPQAIKGHQPVLVYGWAASGKQNGMHA